MKKRTREASTFEMTPLIDVVFLLLIFFMVSTVFKKDELALLLSLPKTEAGDAKSKQTYVFELSSNELAFNGKKTTIATVEEHLKTISDKTAAIDLRIDKEVRYDRVMSLLDKMKKYELTNLSLVTER